MGWIVQIIFAVIICGICYFGGRWAKGVGDTILKDAQDVAQRDGWGTTRLDEKRRDASSWQLGGNVLMGIAIVVFLFWVGLATATASIHQVEAGHRGVVYTFGDITGQRGEGITLVYPWQKLKSANVQVQTLAFMPESKVPEGAIHVGGGLDSFSEETQNVFIDTILRIKVSPANVQGLYRNVGANYIDKLIPGSIAQVFKDETVNYRAVDIAPSREIIRASVEEAITNELTRFSIDVDALLIENISFEPTFETEIQEKQNATQRALKEQELIKAEEAKAQQAIARATGQAEANNILSSSLSPEVIQFETIQKLFAEDSPLQIALLPTGQGIIIDPTTILTQE